MFLVLSLPFSHYFPEEKECHVLLGRWHSLFESGKCNINPQPDLIWDSCRKQFSFLVDRRRRSRKSRSDGQGGLGKYRVTALAGQGSEGTLVPPASLLCGEMALCICGRDSGRKKTQNQVVIPDIEGVGLLAGFL